MKAAFDQMLARARAVYLGGLLLSAGLRLAAFALAALLACTLRDAWFGFGKYDRNFSAIGSCIPFGTMLPANGRRSMLPAALVNVSNGL